MTRKTLNTKAKKISNIATKCGGFGFMWLTMGILFLKLAYPSSIPNMLSSAFVLVPGIVCVVVSFVLDRKADKLFEEACYYPKEEL